MNKFFFLITISVFIVFPFFIEAQDILGQEVVFNIESSYDLAQRNQAAAVLVQVSPKLYWYADENWWNALGAAEQNNIKESLSSLTLEFEDTIYPVLTRTFGLEWSPGIDKDTRMTVLIHPMKKESGGYTDTGDEYPKIQIPDSNEREMIYLNSQYITEFSSAKSFLAHELVHLITFNQKERVYGAVEDVWLNEARAEYAPSLLGYDDTYGGSNLERRVKDFLNKPSDSLTEWRGKAEDYGTANLFGQYLVDHYGVSVLAESLKIKEVGIKSLNKILAAKDFKKDFSEIFADWTVAVLINDCQVANEYCYFNKNLKNLRITPLVNYIPFVGDSVLSVTNTTKDWSGNWHKFVGGNGQLQLDFRAGSGANFKMVYLIENFQGDFTIDEMNLAGGQAAKVLVPDFSSENISLTIIPIAESKVSNFSDLEFSRLFSWTASTKTKNQEPAIPSLEPLEKPISQMTRAEILARIAEIRAVVLQLQSLLAQLPGASISCSSVVGDLHWGMQDNSQVKCLQEFLKSQGSAIYPEGLVTGNFGVLTQQAVIRFQNKYALEILTPLGLPAGTGYVGSSTRAKINQLLTK